MLLLQQQQQLTFALLYISLFLRLAFLIISFYFFVWFALFACPLLLFHSHLGVTHTHTPSTPSTHLLFSHGLFFPHNLSLSSSLALLLAHFPLRLLVIRPALSLAVSVSFVQIAFHDHFNRAALLSFSAIKRKYMVLFKHVVQCAYI